jgi:Family of unknown function (DUF6370)
MKLILKSVLAGVAGLMMLAYAAPSFAADIITVTGEGKCAKCALHETDKCQNVVQKKEADGTIVTYYIAKNDVANDFHSNLCKESKKITVTGAVSEEGGKKTIIATKIEVVKE